MNIEENFTLAVQNHQKNNLEIAKKLYGNILKLDSNHLGSLNNLADLFNTLGEYQKAIKSYEKVIKIKPNYAITHNNLGMIFYKLHEFYKAKECFEKAIEINPNLVDININLGAVLTVLKEDQKAVNYFEKAIEINPKKVIAYNSLGNIFYRINDYDKAINFYEKAIKIDSKYLDSYNNLGMIFYVLGKYQKAKKIFEKIIKMNPSYAAAYNNLGLIYNKLGNIYEAIDNYKKALNIDVNLISAQKRIAAAYVGQLDLDNAINSSHKALTLCHKVSGFFNHSIPLFRLKHDVQQAKYLISKNYKINGIDQFQKIGVEILNRKANKEDKNNFNKKILLTPEEISFLLPFYKSNHTYEPKIISGSHINPNKNWLEVEEEYFNNPKQVIYIDDFLSDETVKELRQFCLISKVWNKEYYNPFLGAFSDNGFISSIHLQIAIDLKKKLPRVFGPHKLGALWGYKYDSTLGKGINVHADFAIHNLNFWITPDEFNNNKNSGGLKVYDVPAPENWTFKDYNASPDKIYKFLKDNNASYINVPYKFNRAVLFNSSYFHETDLIDFKDEYEGRRINMTYLFGHRLVKTKN